MGKPIITIAVCARNAQATIRKAIKSASEQSFPHGLMEIVFVDDGSEDDTLKIIKEVTSKTDVETRIFSGPWRGLGKARNCALYNARGEYILWLDSDEFLEKNFVQKQVSLLNLNPRAGIATASLQMIPSGSFVLTLDMIPALIEYNSQDWTNPSKLPGTGGAIYRVVAAKEAGGFDENLSGSGEDVDIANRIRQKGWSIVRGEGKFYETHGNMSTFCDLWRRYSKQGQYSRRLYEKSPIFFSLYRMTPFASFVAGLLYVNRGYKITHLKLAFLLPFHFFFKMLIWFIGFSKD